MNYIKDTIEYITKAVKIWVIISPWQNAVRVRFGKHMKTLTPGIYIKIPVIDDVYIQTVRLRIIAMPLQTLNTYDDKTATVKTAVGYTITDIKKLYNTLHEPETTVNNIVLGEIADFVTNMKAAEYSAKKLEAAVLSKLQKKDYGLTFEYVKILEFATVKTIRLIQDKHWHQEALEMDQKH